MNPSWLQRYQTSLTRHRKGAIFTLAILALTGTGQSAQGNECAATPSSEPCLLDPGGAHVVKECWETADGDLYLFFEKSFLEVVPATQEYSQMITVACDAMGIGAEDCRIYPMFASIGDNAIAAICAEKAVIILDRTMPILLGSMEARAVVYHELGHHICGHLDEIRSPENELDADMFVGAVFQKLGLALEDAVRITEVFDEDAHHYHPDRAARSAAISSGWAEPESARNCGRPRETS